MHVFYQIKVCSYIKTFMLLWVSIKILHIANLLTLREIGLLEKNIKKCKARPFYEFGY